MSHPAALLDFALHLADLAAAQILPHFRTGLLVENKQSAGNYDPVTVADRCAEAVIRAAIRRAYPHHGILGEEHGFEPGTSEYTWVIDPIDGTRSFVLGQLHWGTLIALDVGRTARIGVMHQPYTGETFYGTGGAAHLRYRGAVRSLAARQGVTLEQAVLCATDPTMFATAAQQRAFAQVAARARAVRYGGDCYTPCLIAAGCADLVIEAGLKPWDVQALIPIVSGAGGVMTDWSGGSAQHASEVVIAANSNLHRAALEALNAQA